MGKHAVIVLADGFEEIEAITPIDLLRRSGVKVTVAGLKSTMVTGAHAFAVYADTTITELRDDYDAIILPGGGPGTKNLSGSDAVITLVQRANARGLLCAAICAAPLVFGKAGLLDGKRFSCFPGIEKEIPTGVFLEKPVVRDGNIITSRGAGTSMDFSLAIIEYLIDRKEAENIAGKILYSPGRL
jgi:4-methyl-5(b-hydroxyethyl)-thiazole monophosphate biosynthesis